jgi:hypothetical protein
MITKFQNFLSDDDYNGIFNQIENSTDIEYLNELEKYIDDDIDNINKDSIKIKQIKAKMRGISVDEMDNLKLKELIKLKTSIQNRISELSKNS